MKKNTKKVYIYNLLYIYIDGIEAARQIQEIRETLVIFMTGYQDEETRRRAEELSPLADLLGEVRS